MVPTSINRVAIADDSALVRFSLNRLISSLENFKVDFEASNGKELIDHLRYTSRLPDLIVLDIGMPVMNGYEVVSAIKKEWPNIKILILSLYSQEYSVNYMVSKGVNGFLSKDGAMSLMGKALNAISTDGYYYSDVAPIELFEKIKGNSSRSFDLSAKQKEVLNYIYHGLSNKEIAEKMGIAKSTVEDYRNALCNKLNIKNRSELVSFAIKNELV
jgi:DNA-binding NarL/FixJ family response regulator